VVNLAIAPAVPFLPQEVHGRRVAIVSGCYSGDPEDGARAFQSLKSFGTSIADLIGPIPYTEMQRFVDGQWDPGFHNYFKSFWLRRLDEAAIETLLRGHVHAASPDTKIQLYHFGGAVARVGRNATAFARRDAPYLLNIAARWQDPAETDLNVGWARELHEAMTPFATGGVYVNFLGEEGQDRVRAAYGEHTYARLMDLKGRYDPTNLFRVNQNIPPMQADGAR
jgi:Berberine and berberine like